jgi:hypothetical protein
VTYGLYKRRDTVLLHNDFDEDGMRGMVVGRVLQLLLFKHDGRIYQCALVEWFERIGDVPDPLTGLWRVRPKRNQGQLQRDIGIVPLISIFCACQIIPMYKKTPLPAKFHFLHTHVAFHSFYVNSFADYSEVQKCSHVCYFWKDHHLSCSCSSMTPNPGIGLIRCFLAFRIIHNHMIMSRFD